VLYLQGGEQQDTFDALQALVFMSSMLLYDEEKCAGSVRGNMSAMPNSNRI